MCKNPYFSVVIPVYNSEKYLDECISSVMSQRMKDFELILVDDESSDNSPAICDKWAKDYPHMIKVIHQKNTGVYIAKRNGIKATKGNYIYVMDNDDLITNDEMFTIIKAEIERTKSDLVIFNAIDDIETGHLLCKIPFKDRQVFSGNRLAQIYDQYLNTKNLHHIWMMVFKRELFDWEYDYTESFRMLRDGPSLILPIISNSSKVLYLEDTFYYWRIQNLSSASKNYDVVNFFYSIRSLHKRVIEYSKKWKCRSKYTEDLIKKNYVADVCIAAVKVRGLSKDSSLSKKNCLKMMAQDRMFKDEFSLKYLELFRIPVAVALKFRQYWMVNLISSFVGKAKGR